VESVCDMCYVCVHLCMLLVGLSIYCVLCCVWGDGCGMFVCVCGIVVCLMDLCSMWFRVVTDGGVFVRGAACCG